MPFKTKYEIFGRVAAPVVSTYDKRLARAEWGSYIRNPHTQGLHRLVQTVEPDGELTKSEHYLYLVYRVRKLWHRYFDCGRKKEDLDESLKLEAELDAWNMRIRIHLESHPAEAGGYQGDEYNFYQMVLTWRDAWKRRQRYKRSPGHDNQVLQSLSSECRQYEREIDQYIKTKLNLI